MKLKTAGSMPSLFVICVVAAMTEAFGDPRTLVRRRHFDR